MNPGHLGTKARVPTNELCHFLYFRAVFTHFHGTLPAATCDQPGKAFTAELVGAASEDEVVIMNGLSVNLVIKKVKSQRLTLS